MSVSEVAIVIGYGRSVIAKQHFMDSFYGFDGGSFVQQQARTQVNSCYRRVDQKNRKISCFWGGSQIG